MKLYAPKYYCDFKCIADKCAHNCCIGWEIDIDNDTMKKYSRLKTDFGKRISESIEINDIPHFRLGANERCPHLTRFGLCEIITQLGEDYLCQICREHPRFYNYAGTCKEVGLGMACEEACRIILSNDSYGNMVEIDDTDEELFSTEFDTLRERAQIYAILSNEHIPYSERLRMIYESYGVSPDILSDAEWAAVISSLEYMDISHKELFNNYTSNIDTPQQYEKILERSLAYFIFRHCTEAGDKAEFISCLGFCLFCERLLSSLLTKEAPTDFSGIVELARIVSEEIEYSEDNTQAIQFEF